jgi:hypothetical protein
MSNPPRDLPTSPLGNVGPTRELRNLHVNGSASLGELREFLAGLKGRKPQEVIGIVSASLLVQSMVIATLATIAVLAVFTVGPYLLYGPPQTKPAAKGPAGMKGDSAKTASGSQTAPAGAMTNSSASSETSKGKVEAPASPGVDVERATKALGIDETKPSDPKKNPLDSPNLDKLLDGLDK